MNNASLRIGLSAAAISVIGAGVYAQFSPVRSKNPAPQISAKQPQPPTIADTRTPFRKDPFMFSSLQESIGALRSPDINMRRSGIESLGQRTLTYTTYRVAPNLEACQELQKHPEVVPDLIRAVQEMPDDDSRQAARLLVFLVSPDSPRLRQSVRRWQVPFTARGKLATINLLSVAICLTAWYICAAGRIAWDRHLPGS